VAHVPFAGGKHSVDLFFFVVHFDINTARADLHVNRAVPVVVATSSIDAISLVEFLREFVVSETGPLISIESCGTCKLFLGDCCYVTSDHFLSPES